jgi:hypothetical protein
MLIGNIVDFQRTTRRYIARFRHMYNDLIIHQKEIAVRSARTTEAPDPMG